MLLYHGNTELSQLSSWIKNLILIFVLKFHGHLTLALHKNHLNKSNVNFWKKMRMFFNKRNAFIGKISFTNSRFLKNVGVKHSTVNLRTSILRERLWGLAWLYQSPIPYYVYLIIFRLFDKRSCNDYSPYF